MEAPTDPAGRTPSRQANRWSIILRESPNDPRVREAFEAWRNADAANSEAWQTLERLGKLAEQIVVAPSGGSAWQAYLAEQRSKERAKFRQSTGARSKRTVRWVAGAAAMAMAASIALLVGPGLLLRLEADYISATAELQRVGLEDGSTVTLSADSAIAVSYSGDERRVTLLRGEAFFEVVPDPKRPFQVLAGEVRTTVVGTAFDVRRFNDDVTVDVERGVVDVATMSGGISGHERLEAGQSIRVEPAGALTRSTISPQLVAAWRQGRLLTEGVQLRDAVDQLRRHFNGTIIISDGTLGSRRVTGAYTLSDPESALRAIARAHGAIVRRVTPWILVIHPS